MILFGFSIVPERTTHFDGHFINWFRAEWLTGTSIVPFLDAPLPTAGAKILFMDLSGNHVVSGFDEGVRNSIGVPCTFSTKKFARTESEVIVVYRAWLASGGAI